MLVARMESVRLLALVAQEGWRVHHMDVKSTFINSDLKEVYVHQPPGFIIPSKENKVLHLCKALYGLQQAPQAWNAKLTPLSSKWGSSRVLMRLLSTGGTRVAMPCW
jgi:hypothetical protein